jgi:hypothetical protein
VDLNAEPGPSAYPYLKRLLGGDVKTRNESDAVVIRMKAAILPMQVEDIRIGGTTHAMIRGQ